MKRKFGQLAYFLLSVILIATIISVDTNVIYAVSEPRNEFISNEYNLAYVYETIYKRYLSFC